jgi:GPI ethanolamine phosphate transferase membrane region
LAVIFFITKNFELISNTKINQKVNLLSCFAVFHSGLVEAWYFYGLLTVYPLLRLSRARSGQRTAVWRDAWLLICALLRRPHDLWSLAYVAISSRLIAASHRGPSAAVAAGAVGWAGFFYQGNSNGLASLDVAAGYVGLSSYRPLLVAAQMLAHTYSAPVLVALEVAASQGLDGRWLAAWSGQRLAAAAFYLLVAAWLREHLFVWSVFAPKLLYEGAHTLVYLVVLTIFKVSSL